jgi:hypothetical protein
MGGSAVTDDTVILDDPAGEGGLAAVLSDLISANVRQDPGRGRLLRGLRGTVEIVAADGADRTVATLRFDGSSVRVSPGGKGDADLSVTGTYESVLAMSTVPVCPYTRLPKPWKRATIDLGRAVARGEVRIHGAAFHPRLAISLLALVSVSA